VNIFALEFPPTSHLIEWPAIVGSGWYAVNKVVILLGLSVIIAGIFFVIASRPQALVPTGAQNFAEAIVDFIRNDIIMQTMGPEGLWWAPFLFTLFIFVFMCNIWEIIPIAQMPVTSRIAIPVFLALMVWFLYIVVGIKHQGPWGYWKNSIFPPGVPWPMYILVTPIELVTVLVVRPLSLSVRLFANMLAGHLLLVSFAVLTSALFVAQAAYIAAALPFALLVALTGFELLVAVLQAFIFTILTAVYLGSSLHPEH
jgi:F-type H+-transporting ATPase subunit a